MEIYVGYFASSPTKTKKIYRGAQETDIQGKEREVNITGETEVKKKTSLPTDAESTTGPCP